MTAQAIAWIWWILATFGVAGLVAFWFLAPVAARLTLQIAVRLLKLVLSTRIGCAVLAAVAAALIVDYRRHAYDDAQYARRTAAFEQAQQERDATIARDTREKVWNEIAAATAANKQTDEQVKEFGDALPPPPQAGNSYLVGADADRLCRIAGQTKCGPAGGKGMPAPRRAGRRAADHAKIRLPDIIRTGARPDQKGQ